jgi:hypothetical protein
MRHSSMPMDIIFQGILISLFQAKASDKSLSTVEKMQS